MITNKTPQPKRIFITEWQREILLPIPGKKSKEAAASKPVARPGSRQKKTG